MNMKDPKEEMDPLDPKAPRVDPTRRDLSINYDTGKMYVPGVGELDLIGPTSGNDLEVLKLAHRQWQSDKALVLSLMKATWICTQCRKRQPGTTIRVKVQKISGADVTVFICVDRKCDGPVVMVTGSTGRGLLIKSPDGGDGLITK